MNGLLPGLSEAEEAEVRTAYLDRARRYYALTDELEERMRTWAQDAAAAIRARSDDDWQDRYHIEDVARRYHRASLALDAQYEYDHELDLDAAIATKVPGDRPITAEFHPPHATAIGRNKRALLRMMARHDAWWERSRSLLAHTEHLVAAAGATTDRDEAG